MKAWHSRSTLLACTALAMLSTAISASAQDGDSTVLQTIEVKGKKAAAGAASDTPLATQTTGEEVAKKEISSIADLGNTTEPGVDFLKSEGGVVIRGLGGPRVATVVDGIPIPFLQNSARSGGPSTWTNADGGSDSFDFSSLSALDVLRGADSSRIGAGSLAGALVLRTLDAGDVIEEGRDWGGISKITYDSERNSIGGSLALAKRFGNTSVLFQGGYKTGDERRNKGDVDAIGADRTKPNPADFDENNLLFKLRHDAGGGHSFGITAERFERDSLTDLKVAQGATTGSARIYAVGDHWGVDDTRRERVSADYNFIAPDDSAVLDFVTLTGYWQRLTKNAGDYGTRAGGLAGPWMRDNMITESSVGLTGAAGLTFEAGSLEHRVTFGGDVSAFGTKTFIDGMDECIAFMNANPGAPFPPPVLSNSCPHLHASQADSPNVNGARTGFYVDDRIAFGDSGFSLTPGLRFDWFDYRPKESASYTSNSGYVSGGGLPDPKSGSRLSPKLRAAYSASPQLEIFAQWAMAYRAPTVNELYLNFANGSGAGAYAVVGNPDLKSETGHGFEIGANIGDESFGGRVTAFHNRYRNFIDTKTTTGVAPYPAFLQEYINRQQVHISGFELRAHKRFDNGVNLHGAVAYAHGKDVITGDDLRSVAPFKGIIGIGYERESWGVDLTGIFSAGMRDDNNANTFDAPGYGIANLTGWWAPEAVKGMRIQAGVYNLFDRKYWNPVAVEALNPNTAPAPGNSVQNLPFYSEPGRTFKLSLTQKF